MKKLAKRRKYTIPLKDVIPNIAKNITDNGKQNINLYLNWQQIIGQKFAQNLTPIKINNNNNDKILYLKCTNGAELQMKYAENEIINLINLYFGSKKIKSIKFVPQNKINKTENKINKPENKEKLLYAKILNKLAKTL